MPHFSFFLSENETPIVDSDPLWSRPLPLSPHKHTGPDSSSGDAAISYGEYFTAARRFIEQNRYADFVQVVRDRTGRSVGVRDLGPIHINLEKHGQFYHPARLTVDVNGHRLSFVVNVAVTAIGQSYLRQDFDNIRLLNCRFPYRFLPQVYARGAEHISSPQANPVEMFLGQWLEDFHEFHLTGEPAEGNDRMLVWDPLRGGQRLSYASRCDLYRQAAMILTAYYNLETFEQIFLWHHAAGDFIVKTDGHRLNVRLVTVRKYAPLFKGMGTDVESIIQALLVFLLNLTLKMRLDKLDGVGVSAWASDDAVEPTLNGFFDGLLLQVSSDRIPGELVVFFAAYLKSLTATDLSNVIDAVFERSFRRSPESGMICKQLKPHADSLFKAIDCLEEPKVNPNMKCID